MEPPFSETTMSNKKRYCNCQMGGRGSNFFIIFFILYVKESESLISKFLCLNDNKHC